MSVKAYYSNKGTYLEEKPFRKPDGEIDVHATPSKDVSHVMRGFGGAFTPAAGHVYKSMTDELKREVLELYFGKEGLRYTLGRVTIGSCDFSPYMYDYAEKDDLSDFSLDEELKTTIPFIKDAMALEPNLELLASSWSPLSEWKDIKEKKHGGRLLEEHYGDYAKYVALYVKKMRENGLNLKCLTMQNEPEAVQPWESCIFTAEEEGKLLEAFHNEIPDVRYYIWDHNRDRMLDRSTVTFENEKAKEIAHGIAFHWYDRDQYDEVRKTHERFKDKELIFTEGCIETLCHDFTGMGDHGGLLRYGRNFLKDLNNGCSAFYDWNLLLDYEGGPNHVGNFCEAPIMSDGKTLRINPSYYAIKHLSRFIERGAKVYRLKLIDPAISMAYLENPDGKRLVIALNEGTNKNIEIEGVLSFSLKENEMATFVIG